jgi:hypothetical protein
MVFSKEFLLGSLKRLAEKVKNGGTVGDIDKDYLVVKTAGLVLDGKITEEDAAEVAAVLESVKEPEAKPVV